MRGNENMPDRPDQLTYILYNRTEDLQRSATTNGCFSSFDSLHLRDVSVCTN